MLITLPFFRGAVALLAAVLLSGCGLTDNTFKDVSRVQVGSVMADMGWGEEEVFLPDNRGSLRHQLSSEIGLVVVKVHPDENGDGLPDVFQEDLPAEDQVLVAEIESALKAAVKKVGGDAADAVIKGETSPLNWLGIALGAAGVTIAGALGLRGRRKRKRLVSPIAVDANPLKKEVGA